MNRRQFQQALAALALPLAAPAARAQSWPEKPVRFVLSQPAGSGPDILARQIGDQLSRLWQQAVIIDNRPGGQNVIGAQVAARAAPDGYTLYYATTAAMVTNVFTFKSLPYDPARDFVPVRLVGRSPFVLAAAASFPAKDLPDLIARAKAQPGMLAAGTEGPKTFSGMVLDSMAATAGIKLNQVPYTKAPEALQDLLGGRLQLVCLPEAALTAYIQGGQVRALAVSTGKRLPQWPQVATVAETLPGFEFTGWNGIFAPAGTPAAVVARINADLDKVMAQPETAQRLAALGTMAEGPMSPAEFGSFMKAERERWAVAVKTIGLQPE
ncbi:MULTISPECIES: Bug family tripartite tricarboxylate transporter substrate binding protein [Pseudacidovorax]|uniref:Bug family tripartite tricarboxylate transporter substrate binding protein n=1 Tax=Pseudacidovorax TaxID=433923 RepID=UPI0003484BB4|nr:MULTISPECIES: tripartite tricarboxylate transporter substrate-binding protein [Pseudacidovorax]MBP6897199.1 tripartite tricarboxylate transporter substrate binding protein [Pseudacidovorax sp.]